MMRILIVDDEPAARAKLRRLLAAERDVRVVGEASNGHEAVSAIRDTAPDVLLLDIRMPVLDGFETLERLASANVTLPKVIFVTAFDAFAVRAFEVRALDYLLKPFDGARLSAALERVRREVDLEHRPSAVALEALFDQLRHRGQDEDTDAPRELDVLRNGYLDRIAIRSVGVTRFVSLAYVEWIEACGNYVRLHGAEGRQLARQTLRGLVDRLDPALFARIHRSAIVNLTRVKLIKPIAAGDAVVVLHSGTRLRLSRSFRAEFGRRMELAAGR
jgi:two-component system LytT family response regulator